MLRSDRGRQRRGWDEAPQGRRRCRCVRRARGDRLAINQVSADTPPSSLVAITPCRMLDTRPVSQVGDHPGPFASRRDGRTQGRRKTHRPGLHHPADGDRRRHQRDGHQPAVGGYLTVYPADVTQPPASNLNWIRRAGRGRQPGHGRAVGRRRHQRVQRRARGRSGRRDHRHRRLLPGGVAPHAAAVAPATGTS